MSPALADPATPALRAGTEGSWRAEAFGLRLEGSFAAPLLEPFGPGRSRGRVRLQVAAPGTPESWPRDGVVPQLEARHDDGRLALSIHHLPGRGYRIWGDGYGAFHVNPRGTAVLCHPDQVSEWVWQRFLVGQVLPAVASLRGFEVLHASAVALDGRAVAMLGRSEAGKTSVAVNLLLERGRFLADDVVALSRDDGRVLAHPGTAVAGVRHELFDGLGDGDRRRIGRELARTEWEVLVAVDRPREPHPLGAIYLVDRFTDERHLRFEAHTAPALLLLATFNFWDQRPKRLTRLLDVCSALSETAGLYRAVVPRSMDARELAAAIAAHAREDA